MSCVLPCRTLTSGAVAETIHRVVVDEPDRLHERVTNRRSHELESSLREVAAERVRFRRSGRNVARGSTFVHKRFSTDQTPDIRVETTKLALHAQHGLRVANGAGNLQPVSDDPGIGQQPFDA